MPMRCPLTTLPSILTSDASGTLIPVPKTPPFLAAVDARGVRLPFAIAWAGYGDLSGGVLARAEGGNSAELNGSIDNTGIHGLMHRALFGR